MKPHSRKLLLVPEHDPAAFPDYQSGISSSTLPALPNRPRPTFNFNHSQQEYTDINGGGGGGFSSYRLNPPFDSSMAITVVLLLTALFLMGFFSIYIRRFTVDEPALAAYRSRRRRRPSSSAEGVDPDTVESLPVYGYGAKQQGMVAAAAECAICLAEFEAGEAVKAIPFCGHVFHVLCIDTWLASHVTCPLCRTPKLFPEEEDGLRVAIGCHAPGDRTVDEGDTCIAEGLLRSSSSCTEFGERVAATPFPRSASF